MHQCVRCSEMHEDGAVEILKGCKCGGRFFFYMKKKDVEKVKEITVNLTPEAKEQLETDALELVGQDKEEIPVILDLESIRMNEPGKFEIDLIDLFKGNPLIFKLEEGKYIIDIVSTFERKGEK